MAGYLLSFGIFRYARLSVIFYLLVFQIWQITVSVILWCLQVCQAICYPLLLSSMADYLLSFVDVKYGRLSVILYVVQYSRLSITLSVSR